MSYMSIERKRLKKVIEKLNREVTQLENLNGGKFKKWRKEAFGLTNLYMRIQTNYLKPEFQDLLLLIL